MSGSLPRLLLLERTAAGAAALARLRADRAALDAAEADVRARADALVRARELHAAAGQALESVAARGASAHALAAAYEREATARAAVVAAERAHREVEGRAARATALWQRSAQRAAEAVEAQRVVAGRLADEARPRDDEG